MKFPSWNEKNIKLFLELFIGIISGILLSIIMLFFMNLTSYVQTWPILILLVVIECSISACFDVFWYRGYQILLIEESMIIASALICIGYGFEVARDTVTRNYILYLILIVHGVSFVLNYIRVYLQQKGTRK